MSEFSQNGLSQCVYVAVLSFIQKRRGRWQEALRELGEEIEAFLHDNAQEISEENSAKSFILRLQGDGTDIEITSESVPKRKSRRNGNRVSKTEGLLSTRELATLTGLSPDYFQKLARSGSMPCRRLGNGSRARFMFDRAEFNKWWQARLTRVSEWQKATSTKGAKYGGGASTKTGEISENPLKLEVRQLLATVLTAGKKS